MSLHISELKGVTEAILAGFKTQGLGDSDAMLEVAKTPEGRRKLAAAISIDSRLVLMLANRADLVRIKGIGRVYSDLMEEAGISTLKELACRSPKELHTQMIKINRVRQFTQRPPSVEQVTDFVDQANSLPQLLDL